MRYKSEKSFVEELHYYNSINSEIEYSIDYQFKNKIDYLLFNKCFLYYYRNRSVEYGYHKIYLICG